MNGKHGIPLFIRHLLQQAVPRVTSIVDDDVEFLKRSVAVRVREKLFEIHRNKVKLNLLNRFFDDERRVLRIRDITWNRDRHTTRGINWFLNQHQQQ